LLFSVCLIRTQRRKIYKYRLNHPGSIWFWKVMLMLETLETGTTTIALICKDGVIMAADRKATAGFMIVDKKAQKIYQIARKMALTTSGTVSDIQLLTKLIKAELSLKKFRTEIEPSTQEASNLLAGMVFHNIRRFSVIPGITHFILAGHDRNGFQVYDIFADGSVSKVDDYFSSGSGSVFALGVLDTLFKPDMSKKEAVELAKRAVNAALQRDAASGEGLDIILITSEGIEEVFSQKLGVSIS